MKNTQTKKSKWNFALILLHVDQQTGHHTSYHTAHIPAALAFPRLGLTGNVWRVSSLPQWRQWKRCSALWCHGLLGNARSPAVNIGSAGSRSACKAISSLLQLLTRQRRATTGLNGAKGEQSGMNGGQSGVSYNI